MRSASPKEVAETEKLRQEIKSLRQQRVLAVVTILGGAAAFLLTNAERLFDLIHGDPKISISTDDESLRRNARFSVESQTGEKGVVAADTLSESRTLSLPPGTYRLTATSFDETVYTRDFTVGKGERRTMSIPGLSNASIRVSVQNQSGRIGPRSQLEFQVESSGNGYVWIFEVTRKNPTLIYPEGCSQACGNEISVDQGLHLPDTRQRAIFAGDRTRTESLLFLVTSSSDLDTATRLAAPFSIGTVLKASGGTAKGNWGYATVSYDISKQ